MLRNLWSLYKVQTVIFVGVTFIISFFFFFQNEGNKAEERQSVIPEHEQREEKKEEVTKWLVDIKGAVHNPGVVSVVENMRILDVIELAGGLLPNGDVSSLNLAEKVYDGMLIVVPKKGEQWKGKEEIIPSTFKGKKININGATLAELQEVPGIGPSKAEAIQAYIKEHGPITSEEDLNAISGFGDKTVERILPYFTW